MYGRMEKEMNEKRRIKPLTTYESKKDRAE
jgi:hypothetical protein